MAAITLAFPSRNGQHVGITGTFSKMGSLGVPGNGTQNITFTSCTLGDGGSVATTFPQYVDPNTATTMNIPSNHIVSVV